MFIYHVSYYISYILSLIYIIHIIIIILSYYHIVSLKCEKCDNINNIFNYNIILIYLKMYNSKYKENKFNLISLSLKCLRHQVEVNELVKILEELVLEWCKWMTN